MTCDNSKILKCGALCLIYFGSLWQVQLFDSMNYLKSFSVGDVWVAVGWSSDVILAAKRMSNVAVVVPKSGSSLWADLWVCC
jgi:spermidine/putrescine-binding protein